MPSHGATPIVAGVGGFFTGGRRIGYSESPGCSVPLSVPVRLSARPELRQQRG